jgi:hypothetical protein
MPTHSRQSSNSDYPPYASRFILINHGELIMKTLPTILTTMTLVAGLSLAAPTTSPESPYEPLKSL